MCLTNESIHTEIKLNENRLASSSYDHSIIIWDFVKGELERVYNGHTGVVWTLAKLEDSLMASGSDDKTIRIWNLTEGEVKYTMMGLGSVWSLIKLDNGFIASGSGSDNSINIWKI
jgi:WD40 repeat protein